jgi:hypothetical protein
MRVMMGTAGSIFESLIFERSSLDAYQPGSYQAPALRVVIKQLSEVQLSTAIKVQLSRSAAIT